MSISAVSGPTVSFGLTLTSSGADMEHNPDRGPSAADLGEMLLDPRVQFSFQPGQGATKPFYGWAGLFGGPVVDAIPKTISSNGVALAQTPVAGTALTLATSANSSSVLAGSITPFEGGAAITVTAIDSVMAGVPFGVSGTVNIWDPTKAVARGVSINLSSNADGGSWTIAGRDLYGQKMSESLTAGSTQLLSKKAYKYISSILPSTTVTSTGVTVGTQDLYGFPLRVDTVPYLTIWLGPSSGQGVVNFSTGANHTFAVTSAASNTTGDIRGTYASSVASNSTAAAPVRLAMFISPSVANLATITSTTVAGLVGLTQFSSV